MGSTRAIVDEVKGLIADILKQIKDSSLSQKQTRECTSTSGRGAWIKIIEDSHKSRADLMKEIEEFGDTGKMMTEVKEQHTDSDILLNIAIKNT